MKKFQFDMLREGLNVQLVFKKPILEWHQLPARFFSLIYDALSPNYAVNTTDFSFRWGNSVSELAARYSIFGGASSVTLLAERIVIDIPNMNPNELQTALSLMATIHDVLPKKLPEAYYETVEIQSLGHLDLFHENNVAEFLGRYRIPSIDNVFGPEQILNKPGLRFEAVAADNSWKCVCTAERSMLTATAIFVLLSRTINKTNPSVPFLEKYGRSYNITKGCLDALGLEPKSAQ